MVPQDVTENVLSERLTALGGTVHRGHAATKVSQFTDGVEVTVASPAGERTIRARYVVGGDGMHSVVREAAGIAFEGARYEESFVLADIHMDWALKDEVSLFFSEAGLVVVAPLPGRFVSRGRDARPCAGAAAGRGYPGADRRARSARAARTCGWRVRDDSG